MSKAGFIIIGCLCCMLAAAPMPARAADRNNPYEKAVITARSEIWQSINSGRCSSAAVSIMVDGMAVYTDGFGMADREKNIPVTLATIFNIGSISKVYVTAAVMLLVDDGKVVLDRPVTDYLPEFRMADDRYRKITVRMLLNHQSGLPGTMGTNQVGYSYDDNVKKVTIDTLKRAHLKHDPGANAVYCNDGFTLAEMIVERVSRGKYIDFLNKRIFRPLGLKNTGMGVGEIRGKSVALYYDAGTGKKHPPETLSVLAAGGLSATAGELARFAEAVSAGNRLLKKESAAEMKKAQISGFPLKLRSPKPSFGLGWDMTGIPRYDAAGIQVLGKSGGTGYYSSMVYTAPDKRITVAVIAAGSGSGAMTIALNILDAVLVEKKLVAEKDKSVQTPPVAQKLPAEDLSFGGYYTEGAGLCQVVFDADKNTVALHSINGHEKTPYTKLVYNNGYYHDAKGRHYYFAGTGREGYLVVHQSLVGFDTILMQRVKPAEKPLSLRINMDDRLWLRRNVQPVESTMCAQSHVAKSFLHKELPGYVYFLGLKRVDTPEFAGMPFDSVRDQTELALFDRNGAAWAWLEDMLYSPAESAVVLKAGDNTVNIKNAGYNEWLAAKEGMVLSFTKTGNGRIIVFSGDGSAIYDSIIDTGDIYVAGGSYIEYAGPENDVLAVRARPATANKKQ